MRLQGDIVRHDLKFKFDAGTSRGVLRHKTSFFIKVFDNVNPSVIGIGECGPLQGLSIDYGDDLELKLLEISHKLSSYKKPSDQEEAYQMAQDIAGNLLPSVRFALETAFLDLIHGGRRYIFNNRFTEGLDPITINGLIWMGSSQFMLQQIKEKIDAGFTCIKIKIGAIDFETECGILASIRNKFSPDEITLRLDANGAFSVEEAGQKLDVLLQYAIHSIEQPIAAGQWAEMKKLCRSSPIPIALDEDLIGVDDKKALLEAIKPDYIILKPTLLGGFKETGDWIALAEERNIKWWITSALESNIGLNAISQFTASFDNQLPQGLGTGQLYQNNLASPLETRKGNIWYNTNKNWELHPLGL